MAMAKCAACGGPVSTHARFCPHCGHVPDSSATCGGCIHRDPEDFGCSYDYDDHPHACPAYYYDDYD